MSLHPFIYPRWHVAFLYPSVFQLGDFFNSATICINMFGVSANVPIFPMFVTYLIINWLQDIYLTAKRVNVSYENKVIYENIWTLKQFLRINKIFFQIIGPISHCLTSHTLSYPLRWYQSYIIKRLFYF